MEKCWSNVGHLTLSVKFMKYLTPTPSPFYPPLPTPPHTPMECRITGLQVLTNNIDGRVMAFSNIPYPDCQCSRSWLNRLYFLVNTIRSGVISVFVPLCCSREKEIRARREIPGAQKVWTTGEIPRQETKEEYEQRKEAHAQKTDNEFNVRHANRSRHARLDAQGGAELFVSVHTVVFIAARVHRVCDKKNSGTFISALFNPFTPRFKMLHSPKCISEAVRIGSIIICRLSKL